ncbi:MAG: apolipoprotein N-acyltransferase [Verrucomicrobiales bacterium]|nr:apolipoprotein N-acyltransferase [Verrucomicrobiales bacterium]
MSLNNKWWPWAASALSGILLALCFAPWELGSLVWVWSWPLLAALWYSLPEGLSLKQIVIRSFLLGYTSGVIFFSINSHWMYQIWKVVDFKIAGVGAVLGMGFYLGVYVALFSVFAATVGKLKLPPLEKKQPGSGKKPGFPMAFDLATGKDLFGQSLAVLKVAFLNGACWCGLEWVRSIAFTGYGWNSLGVALKNHLMMIQFADVIGQLGYGFVVMFCGVVGFATILRFAREIHVYQSMRPHLDFSIAVAMVIALFLYGFSKVTESQPENTVDLDVRIMQMNTSINDKYNPDIKVRQQIIWDYRDLSRAFLDNDPCDLLVWPETALPTVFSWESTFTFLNEEILKGEDFYLLMGIEDNDVERRLFNTITLMKGEAESFQMYSKIHLVPFGEFVPGRDWKIPVFDWIFGKVITQDFERGTSYDNLILEKDGTKIGIMPLVCFEDTVARHARKFVRDSPQILVNVTNDAWFYDSAAPHQHFATSLFRCIELRRPMIRAANTGVSGFIDERGSIYDRNSKEKFPRIIQDEATGDTYIRGSLPGIVKVDLNPPMSIYARIGDAFSIVMGLIALAFFAWWVVRERKAKR